MHINTSIPSALANQALYNSQPEEVTLPDSTIQTGTQSTKEATMQVPTPVFDFTATINAALAQAIAQAVAPLVERIALLERSLVVADKAAQGSEATLFSRVEDLETLVRDRLFGEQPDKYKNSDIEEMSSRLALIEDKFDNITTASDERIKEIAEEVAEQAVSAHNYDYDHDEYDRLFNDLGDKVEEAVTEAIDEIDFEDKVRDILRHASVNIDI
jgi:hypothetical protein